MFSTRLSRVAQRATSTAGPSTSAPLTTAAAAHKLEQCFSGRTSHQRRPSSSKASSSSCPPDNSTPKATGAEVKGTDGQQQQPSQEASAPHQQHQGVNVHARKTKRSGRLLRKSSTAGQTSQQKEAARRKDGQDQRVDGQKRWASLPVVPDLHGWTRKDLDVSSFFSLHRPLSLSSQIPPPSSPEAFASIFAPSSEHPHPEDAWANGNSAERRPEDVVYTLHNTIDALENHASAAENDGVRWEVMQESPNNASQDAQGVTHLDGAPQQQSPMQMRSLEELVAQFRPFNTPPPPEPFPEENKANAAAEKKRTAKPSRKEKGRQFQTTITLTEEKAADGGTVFHPHATPLVRVSDRQPSAARATPRDPAKILKAEDTSIREPFLPQQQPTSDRSRAPHQPFRERMQKRQTIYLQQQRAKQHAASTGQGMIRRAPSPKRIKMFLISVKRQRKLKMKKHKYKKLMKRTRNLRRRLDRP
ncbi:hypothetical protein KC357_g3315 [Hortaea werneckii]|nr:hypothetical protein KC357_g3315 [Hortaea werneckii]